MTLEISRTACNIRDVTPGTLTDTDTCIGYHVTRFEASRNVLLHTRYVSTCVGAGCGRVGEQRKQKQSAVAHVILTCDMYKSSLKHIHDPVLSLLKMKGILSFMSAIWFPLLNIYFQSCYCLLQIRRGVNNSYFCFQINSTGAC
jgi:hypothetical protein